MAKVDVVIGKPFKEGVNVNVGNKSGDKAVWGNISGTLTNQTDLSEALAAKYQKPSGGIPKTDLASAVQTSLGKADTALQSFTEADPTVPAWAKANNPPTEIFWAEYGVTTRAEIIEAVTASKVVAVLYNNRIYIGNEINTAAGNTNNFYFGAAFNGIISSLYLQPNGTWGGPMGPTVESVGNKVSTIVGNESDTNKYPNTKAVADYVASRAEVFVAEYGVTTASEIAAAYAADKLIICNYLGHQYKLSTQSDNYSRYIFNCLISGASLSLQVDKTTSVWYVSNNTLQDASARRSSWQSTPDNGHYPSEKLVKDSLDAKADKVSSPTAGDLAKLDANGNLADSGLTPNMLSLFPDFDNLTPLQTIEYDVTAPNDWCKLFERSNAEGTLASDVVGTIACRITVTSSNLEDKQVIDLVCLLPGQSGVGFPAFILPKTPKRNTAANYGIYQLKTYVPRGLGSGYAWGVLFLTSAGQTRHLKIEIYKTASLVYFFTSQELSDIGTTYNEVTAPFLADKFKPLLNYPGDVEGNASSATRAQYIDTYLPVFLGGEIIYTGEALYSDSLAFISEDNKMYGIWNTTKAINPDGFVVRIAGNIAINTQISVANKQSIGKLNLSATSNPNVTLPTFPDLGQLFLRCSMSEGKIYSDAVVTTSVSAGYTWIALGYSKSNVLMLNTNGKPFFTLDANGKLTHINGREIAGGSATGAVTDVTVGGVSVVDDGVAEIPAASASALAIDSTPTANSTNLVTSGGVYAAIPTIEALTSNEIDTLWTNN